MARTFPSVAAGVSLAIFLLSPVSAAENACSASYVTDEVRGEETIDTHATNFQAINIFSFQFDGSCRVVAKSPWVEQVSQTLSSEDRRLILINIVNEIELTPGPCRNLSPGQLLQDILSDPIRRANHIREIVAISALGRGVEIDYEHVLAATTPYLTQFMKELRTALPPEKKLAAVVQPKTQGGGEQGQTVDWRGIEPYVDYLRVMAYYYSWNTSPPGPVVTRSKLNQLADYILTNPTQSIPSNKARLLLSLYGWDWPIAPKSPGRLLRYEEAVTLAQSHNSTLTRDPAEDTLHFQYTDSSGTLHEVWFDDAQAQQKRIELLLAKDFPAIDLWHLNTGDPALWNWFLPHVRTDCPSLAAPRSPPATATVDRLSAQTVKVGSASFALDIEGHDFSGTDLVLFGGNPNFPTFIDAQKLQIAISSADLQHAGAFRVAVAQNGRISNALNLYIVGNPVLESIEPPTIAADSPAFTLVLRGQGFEPNSQVRWNTNVILPTRFINDKELRADVAASQIPEPGAIRVGVVNPTSDGRISRNYIIGEAGGSPPAPPVAGAPPLLGFAVGPNPWKASDHTGGIRFFGTSVENVRIYTVSGHFVKNVATSNGVAEWDLRNDSGEDVVSGLYFYLATRNDGGKERGTVAIIR